MNTRWLYLRLLGVIWLAAFASLWGQLDGLYGSAGILPIADVLETRRVSLLDAGGLDAALYWLRLPTLFWLGASDFALNLAAAAGCLAAALVVLNIAPAPALLACWALYLSFVSGDVAFLTFQWDMLLLEAGLLGALLAPWGTRPGLGGREPSLVVIWLHRWLLIRVIFWSGVVKLMSGDPTWRDLTAMTYHYWTQPLPTWTAWYAHQLPALLHRLSAAIMFLIELVAPLLLLVPGRCRVAGAGAIAALMLLITATGNYGFFNLLTLALCVMALEDRQWVSRVPQLIRPPSRWDWRGDWRREIVYAPLVALVLTVGAARTSAQLRGRESVPEAAITVTRWAAGFRSINSYGLFATMTTTRPEIEILGSLDGEEWRPYRFYWKVGPLDARPGFVPLHMPRLDWRMWFAALSSYDRQPWMRPFLEGLLEGRPEVLGLLAEDPFGGYQPRYVRAMIYRYRFTTPEERAVTGDWWAREAAGAYSPMLSR